MTPVVSVVVPVYNCVAFIDATMQSILAQTFNDFELVVSDNASTDGTWEALQRYAVDPRVRLSRHASNVAAIENFQSVTDLATGDLLKLVCADDLLYPDCLAVQVAALTAHSSAVLAACTMDVVDAAGKTVFRNRGLAGLRDEVAGSRAIRRTVLAGTNIFGAPACVMFRRTALVDAGGWDGRSPFVLDLATYCAVLLRGNLVAEPRPLAAFRLRRSQWSEELVRTHPDYHHVIGLQRELAAARPGLLGRRHLFFGSARARVNALGRKAVYRWLGRRLDPSPAATAAPPDGC
ncbi:glycosyltransferase [Mycobacterium sp. 663a-19]|uniref:glycosyltransferase family 2 protein n=1 Tax=Mycobacterium sp. 663a-19 TaxID=2986148 RepID=UPI002D1F4C55|nr:glycosyltransferase [Mycobacterium sp. 663a-19]MEB3983904.1 glycosyltransferase [Mycobacterium sp. 663a-19]